ncbi:hypothetical protein M2103_000682 [Ereboglobus sp. PH5-5]|uniref:hypothetical protein n=1 Tax=Ereboglobus sp. PH5-5 TaxID=2940529 RepID=UPI0024075F77|nr:hypothetical protein [Ereboglobus sp. PH5-5]MDF9832472.1 hypothetical protein [Ereboglobus sp. PH5-5]
MQSYEVLKEILKTTSAKQIAADMGLSLSLIYRWTETVPQGANTNSSNNPLDRVAQLLAATRSQSAPHGDMRIAQWVCEQAGGFFIKNAPTLPQGQGTNLIPATNAIVQEFADMLYEIASASADLQVSLAEAKNIRRRWEGLKSVTEGFVRAAEKGHFREDPAEKKPSA